MAAVARVRAVRTAGFAAVLLFSLGPEIALWDATLLSESLALSLTAALVASWLWIARRPSPWAYAAMLAVALAWALVRDPHAYAVAGLAVALGLSLAAPGDAWGSRRLRAGAAAALLVFAIAGVASANLHFARWGLPVQNVISLRIAGEPERLQYFTDRGMPATPELLAAMEAFRERGADPLRGPPGHDDEATLAAATPFHRWVRTEGRATYTEFLLTHPGFVAGAFADLRRALLDPEVMHYSSARPAWSASPVSDALYPRSVAAAVLMLAAAVGIACLVAARHGPRREWLVPVVLIAFSLPFAIFVYHGGALEPDRHALVPSVWLRLGALLLLLFALDRWREARSAAGPTGSTAAAAGAK